MFKSHLFFIAALFVITAHSSAMDTNPDSTEVNTQNNQPAGPTTPGRLINRIHPNAPRKQPRPQGAPVAPVAPMAVVAAAAPLARTLFH